MLVSIYETGRMLGVCRSTVNKLINQKSIEAVHVRRRKLVRLCSIHTFVANQSAPIGD